MSELQLGLAAIGAAVVVGVFFYNKWKELQYRREAQGNFGSRHEDVLMRGGSRAGSAAAHAARSDRVEPVLETAGLGRGSPAELSETLDFIVQIEAVEEIPGEAVLGAAAAMRVGGPPGRPPR